ncbi:hypothetical protein GCM10010433_61810 [Streptomyces pulveraceus]|uniref:Uncharacterized protein n=1 Tax=Streptomyces pulveraceus TaxID=68258 RepID=A0ABW1GUG8_9ACTN
MAAPVCAPARNQSPTAKMVEAAMSGEELTAAQDTARTAHGHFYDAAAAYFSANT